MGIHLAYVANNNTNRLFTSYSGNGKDWQSRTRVGNQSSKRAAKLSSIRFGPEPFVLAYVSNNKFNQLLVTNSSDGQKAAGHCLSTPRTWPGFFLIDDDRLSRAGEWMAIV
jgi:hypothetical protein